MSIGPGYGIDVQIIGFGKSEQTRCALRHLTLVSWCISCTSDRSF